jgi:GntR family transcriptional regulator / MocR family aminotransferase
VGIEEARWWRFEPRTGETLRRALQRTLQEAIEGGALRPGVRLPSSRALAAELGISRGVVTDAYEQLAIRGFLESHDRAAPTVAQLPTTSSQRRAAAVERFTYDFIPTTPDVTLFPMARWVRAAQRAARASPVSALDYGESAGELLLRDMLADHLGRTRGVRADAAQITVVQGAAQAIDLVLRALRSLGVGTITVENPSHTTQPERIREQGFELAAQPVDEEGIVLDGLADGAVLVTPSHQFPTGVVLSEPRRDGLVHWAEAAGGLIIEDDYDAEFRYDREPVRALQGTAPDHVVQIGTVSKTLVPALRLGWIVAPPRLAREIQRHKRLVDDFTPTLDQLTLAEFFACGDYDRHVRRVRSIYRGRRNELIRALSLHLPDLEVTGIAAGLHVVLRLPPEVDDRTIAQRLAERGVRAPALTSFEQTPQPQRGLVLGYGRIHEEAIEQAVEVLAQSVSAALANAGPSAMRNSHDANRIGRRIGQ